MLSPEPEVHPGHRLTAFHLFGGPSVGREWTTAPDLAAEAPHELRLINEIDRRDEYGDRLYPDRIADDEIPW